MASLQYRRCAWLLNIINIHAPITREEINRYWRHDQDVNPYGETEIPLRTFQKTLRAMEDYFDITVHCNRATNEYSLEGGKLAGLSRTRKVTVVDLATRELQQWRNVDAPVQLFRIDVIPEIAERLRENPICKEQREVTTEEDTDVAVFEYLMKPSMVWYEAIRSLGPYVKVLYPNWLANMLREDAQMVAEMYDEENYTIMEKNNQLKVLNLIIKQVYFDQIMAGTKVQEFREVKPTTYKQLILHDEEGFDIEDENGLAQPIHYDAIRFFVGYKKDRDSALVEVTDACVQYFVDENDEVIEWQDENGVWWQASQVIFNLGKILEKDIHEKQTK